MIILALILSGAGFFLYNQKDLITEKVTTMTGNVNNEYDHLFIKYGNKYGVDWKFLKRIAWIESRIGLNSRVATGIREPANIEGSKSYDGLSWGIMQTTIATSNDYIKGVTAMQLNNPEISISIGAQHVAFLKRAYPQFSERDLAMAYNHGQGNQLNFLKKEKEGTLKETEYLAGRDYFNKYKKAKELIP